MSALSHVPWFVWAAFAVTVIALWARGSLWKTRASNLVGWLDMFEKQSAKDKQSIEGWRQHADDMTMRWVNALLDERAPPKITVDLKPFSPAS